MDRAQGFRTLTALCVRCPRPGRSNGKSEVEAKVHKLNAHGFTKIVVLAALCGNFLALSSAAQSLNPDKPAPLKAGPNRGTVDGFVGPNYFYFWAGPGDVKVRASFKSMTLFGSGMRTSLTVELSDEKKTWTVRKVITSLNEPGETTFTSNNLKEKIKTIVAVIPPSGALVRTGGDYEIEATGAVKFDPEPSAIDLLVGVYTPMSIYENENTAVKFSSDGTLEFASGTVGKWKLFDATDRIFTVSFRTTRLSLKLVPGRGLVQVNDPTSIVFQQHR
jgi:hypothetical protein